MSQDDDLLDKSATGAQIPDDASYEELPQEGAGAGTLAPGAMTDANAVMLIKHADHNSWWSPIALRLIEEGAAPVSANLIASGCPAGTTLFHWATRYLLTQACGRAKGTCEGKSRDLAQFICFYMKHHDHVYIDAWCEADTRHFLRKLCETKQNATVNRTLATLKHFAKYVHEQPGSVFARYGLPTANVSALPVDERTRGGTPGSQNTHGRARPQRNLASA